MKHIKIFENLEELIYDEVQSLIDNNQFLKGKVEANKDTVIEAGDYILLIGDLKHITDAHIDETIPGSKFNKEVDLKKAIVDLVTANKPSQITKGFGTSEVEVTDPKLAEKFKWLGQDCKTKVGEENVHQLDVNSEEFKSMNVYNYKDSRGNEFSIKVKEGDGEETTFLSFIGAKIGEIGGKPVLSVVTAFPGKNGAEVSNRNDFMKSGYYFTTKSKQVIENSTGQISESTVLKFSEFNETMQYAVLKHSKDLHDKEVERRKEKADKNITEPENNIKSELTDDSKNMESEEIQTEMDQEESQPEMQSQEDSEMQRHESLRIKLFGR